MTKKGKISLIALVILILVSFNLFQKDVRGFFYKISSPFQRVFWKAGDRVSDFFKALVFVKDLKQENKELKTENQQLLSQLVELKNLEKENQILRQALNLDLEKDFKLIQAQIISKDISQDIILINKGSEQGIEENMPVITSQKALCGKVSEVYNKFSKVVLISNKKSSFDGKVLTESKEISALVSGRGGLNVYLELIPQEEEIKQEDLIISCCLGGVYPDNLLIGKISKIKKGDTEPFQEAEISPFCVIKEIEELFIISEVFKPTE